MKEYMINSKTLAIIPYLDKKSRVLEVDNYWVINRKPNIIMNHNCMFNGSSMEGRVESTILLTGYTYKSPIMVREDGFLIFFPTSSPRLSTCAWIALNNIKYYYYDTDKNKTIVTFIDNQELELDVSLGVFNNQYLRATRLDSIIRKIKAENI